MTNVPPCVRALIKTEGAEALDNILSYYRTFGTDGLEPVLWEVGYFTLDTYAQRREAVRQLLTTVPPALCFSDKVPDGLKANCSKDCPLRNPKVWLARAVKSAKLSPGLIPVSRVLTVEMHDGSVFVSSDTVFSVTDPLLFLQNVAEEFIDWFEARYGVTFTVPVDDVALVFKEKLWGGLNDDSSTVR